MNNLEWIVFDLGNVVVNIDVGRPAHYLSESSGINLKTVDAVFRDEFHLSHDGGAAHGLYEQLQKGQVSGAQFIEHVYQALEQRITRGEIHKAIMMVILGERQDTLDLIKALSQQYKIACYSNTHDLHWDGCLVDLQSFGYFQEKMASHLSGFAKPDDSAYQHIIASTKVVPEKILFVDDIDVNVIAAQRNGLKAVQFSHPDDVRNYLKSM